MSAGPPSTELTGRKYCWVETLSLGHRLLYKRLQYTVISHKILQYIVISHKILQYTVISHKRLQ